MTKIENLLIERIETVTVRLIVLLDTLSVLNMDEARICILDQRLRTFSIKFRYVVSNDSK